MPDHLDRILGWAACVHALLAIVASVALLWEAAPILGVHPALKPMKFALSIAMFLGSMAFVVPALTLGPEWRRGVSWLLSLTMAAEMTPIVVQALRATTSHFNRTGALDTALWHAMVGAIVVATVGIVMVATVATVRPLLGPEGGPLDPLLATAWRAGLWMVLFAAWSGFAMGGRLRHSVGGDDGGPGLAVVNWSTTHGDLRVSHFVALHALQILPVTAVALARLPLGTTARWSALLGVMGLVAGFAVWTMGRALAARPFW